MDESKKIPLLDLGNVVVKVDFEPFFQWLQSCSQVNEPEKIKSLLTSSLFYDFEFGNIKRAEFAQRVRALYKSDFSDDELASQFCGIFPSLVEGMEALLPELAQMGPIYCLTNTNEIHLQHCLQEFPVLQSFTKVFSSFEMKRRKPYPGIYRDVAKEIGVDARNLIFFDDVQANVKGAIRAGLEAHLFSDGRQVKELLVKEKTVLVDNEVGGTRL